MAAGMLRAAALVAAPPTRIAARRCDAAPPCAAPPLSAPRRRRRGAALAAGARGRGERDGPASEKKPARGSSAPAPPPLSPEEGAPPPDMWEGEQFEALGTFGYVALFIVAGLAAIAGAVASSTYNDGAVGVDFQAAGSAEKAVEAALAAAGAKATPAPPL